MHRLSVFLTITASFFLFECSSVDHGKIVGIKIYDYKGDYSFLVSKWKEMGINTCFVSSSLAGNDEFRDILKRNKIKVWLIFPVFQNPEILIKDSSLYGITNKGNIATEDWVEFVCPSRNTYRNSKVEELSGLIKELNPDGISIDFIRHFVFWEMIYPDREPASIERACFCDSCLLKFSGEEHIVIPDSCGTPIQKADYILKHHQDQWDIFRCDLITTMVKELGKNARVVKPDIKINVHAVPWRETDFDSAIIHVAGQDLKKISPFTDYVSPMCYSQMLKRDEEWISGVVDDMDRFCPGKILPSIQVYPAYIDDVFTAESFRKCLLEALKPPSLGVVFFSWPLFEKDSSRMEVVKEVI